jgi:hypothetical protein
MYGAIEAYLDSLSLDSLSRGKQQVTPQDPKNHLVVKRGRNVELGIHRERGQIWLKAVLYYGDTALDRIEEFLVEDVKENTFLLTSRVTHGSVPITVVARRHSMFPLNSLVRMRVNDVS